MKIEAKLIDMRYDFLLKGTRFEFFCYGNETPNLEKYLHKKINLEFKNEKRSLSANGYLWVLLGELQEKLKIPKEEIYRQYIYNCGTYAVLPLPNKDVNKFIESWSHNGLGWVCDTTTSKLKGYTNVLAYYGTSTYSKEEMGVLLEQVVQDCQEQGIPVKKEEEIESLLKELEDESNNN